MAASWCVDSLSGLGECLSRECEFYGISVLLGPAMNLKRHPGGGRNLEYFSEDPFLSGCLAAAHVNGVQASGRVGACLKHFAVNNQESHRFVVDAIVDERTLRELYLRNFQIAIEKSDPPPAMVMGAYNRLNGTYCCENEWLLQRILRHEWKYEGVCVTDWGATNDRIAAIRAGMDLEMPGNSGVFNRNIRQQLILDPSFQSNIDSCASRTLELLRRLPTPSDKNHNVFKENHEHAYNLALECPVLLKNEDSILPLSRSASIAVIGEFARESRYQGMGSSHCTATKVEHAFENLTKYNSSIAYAKGYPALASDDVVHPTLIEEAKDVARSRDIVLLFLGLPEIIESEGFDRRTLLLPKQHIALLEAITSIHSKVVVVLNNGGMVELPPCISKVSAILECYLLGQAGGPAVADLLFGKVSPSGRLPETMVSSAEYLPSHANFPGTRDRVEYREGLNVGYRYFNSRAQQDLASFAVQTLFPFGHGLTYTRFEYSQLRVTCVADEAVNKTVKVSVVITNVGEMTAKEVVQLYVAPPQSIVYRPTRELKAFSKIELSPQESRHVDFVLTEESFSFFDIGRSCWIVEPGSFEIQIGASIQDIRLKQIVTFHQGESPSIQAQESYPASTAFKTDDDTFARRFGDREEGFFHSFDQSLEPTASMILDRNSLLKEAAKHSRLGRLLYWLVYKIASREIPPGPMVEAEAHMVRENVENLPLRTLVLFGKGSLAMETMDGLIALMNGRVGAAVQKLRQGIWYWILGKLGR